MTARLLAFLAALAFAAHAFAQAYPAKPIKLVVGFPPGGSGDFPTRLIADEMARSLGFWLGLYVPAGTPSAAVHRLHEAAAKGLARPEVREKIALQGMDPTPSASPQAFEAEIKQEAPVLEKLIRDSGARVE